MDTTASRGGVVPDDPPPAPTSDQRPDRPGAARVEVASMPDGRTIRFYVACGLVSGTGGYSDAERSHGAEPQ